MPKEMIYVTFEVTVQEGYSDQRGIRRRAFQRGARMEAVPRKGETVETAWGHGNVSWIDWDPWTSAAEPVFIRLEDTFTGAEGFETVVKAFTDTGWE